MKTVKVQRCILVAIFAATLLSLVPSAGYTKPVSLTGGVWAAAFGPEMAYFELRETEGGALTGEANTIRDGRHSGLVPMKQVVWKDPDIEMVMQTGAVFKGRVDLEQGRIEGALFYNGNKLSETTLEWTDPAGVAGLRARPGPAPGEPVYTYSQPAKTDDGWEVSTPEETGLDRSSLERLVTDVIEGKAGALHALLIVKDGKLVLDEYFYGYNRDDIHRQASVTKSVSSLLVGLAVDQGKIEGVDVPVATFFPEDQDLFTKEWSGVTLRHLLTMSMGVEWSEEEANRTHGAGEKFFREIFARRVSGKPGEKWQYVSANVNLLGGVIKHATGLHADVFAARFLFEPLGITTWNWDYGQVDGYRMMDGSLRLRPRDMAKLGELVATNGRWHDRQVLSEEWMSESTDPQIATVGGPEKYGYLWWLFQIPAGDGVETAVVANGRGSQFISVFRDHNLVVVTTGANDDNGKQFAIGRLLSQHLLSNL